MKKVLAIAVLVVLLVGIASMAMASESPWRIYVQAGIPVDDSRMTGSYGQAWMGAETATSITNVTNIMDPTATSAFALIQNGSYLRSRDVVSLSAPVTPVGNICRSWTVRVIANGGYVGDSITVRIGTDAGYGIPNTTNYVYKLYEGTNVLATLPANPAVGTKWLDVVVPVKYLTLAATPTNIKSQAYTYTFTQEVVPEPSSLLALGTGLMGLAGLVSKRRRG